MFRSLVNTSRRHILFVIVGISAGTGTFCKSLGAGLRKLCGDEFKVSLLSFRADARRPENACCFDESHALAAEVHDDWRRAVELPISAMRLRQAVTDIRPDLVFSIGTFANVVSSLAIDGVPVVLSEHLNMTHRLSGATFGPFARWFMRRAYPDRLMVVASHELADDLRQNFGVTRAVVIPNGIDASIVRRRAGEQLAPAAVPTAARYFISVGRLTAQKDIATLLRGFAIARQHGLADDLLIVGDGEQRAMLENLAGQLGIADATRFLGHCPNPYPLIRGARALILSSIWEGFAYVPIEAMALGVPVISTACPSGPAEILGNGQYGILVPPRDPQRLAEAMLSLATSDTLHQHLSAKALCRAQQLSIENVARQYRQVFLAEMS
ncbi:MAG TPA: glycosyltransferase [Tepidisphaeraceae bacterium]|nr:glycosyltransferase [Tepidisphaeraceae bacterium]